MGTLDGMVAIITARHGARVALTDILTEQGAAVAAGIGPSALFVAHDVSSEEGWNEVIAAAMDAFGRIDVLVDNAAIAPSQSLFAYGATKWAVRGMTQSAALELAIDGGMSI